MKMIRPLPRSPLLRLVRRAFSKWPRRITRSPLRIILSDDMRNRPRCLNAMIRQAGYTNGDRVVVMLESDFQRVADLAAKKIDSPLMAMVWHHLEHSHLERISSTNTSH